MKTALIVDDSSTVRMMMTSIVKKLGFETLQAHDGMQALSVFEQNPQISVAFVDWNMPAMSGIEVVKHLRAHYSRDQVRIIMVTTETEMSRVVTALNAGIDEYVMKPFTADVIKEKMQMVGLLPE